MEVCRKFIAVMAAAGFSVLFSVRAQGSEAWWIGAGSDYNWTTGANWQGGTAPVNDGTADVLFISMRRYRASLGATSQSINSLVLYGPYHEFEGTGGTLTIGTGGLLFYGENAIFNSTLPINLTSGTQYWYLLGNGDYGDFVRINGAIAGSNVDWTKDGNATLILNGASSLTGTSTFTLNGGVLQLGNDNALSGASVVITGSGTTVASYNGDRTIANPVTIDPISYLYLDTYNGKLTFTGPITLNGSPWVY